MESGNRGIEETDHIDPILESTKGKLKDTLKCKLDNFFQIKPLEEWLKPENGCILENEVCFVTLNIMPSSFGHSLIIPKKVIYEETDLHPEELRLLAKATKETFTTLKTLVHEQNHIVSIYEAWMNDKDLNKTMPCRDRISKILDDLEDGHYDGQGNIFVNYGPIAGQLVRHYHRQVVPRFDLNKKGLGEATFQYLHGGNL